MISPRPGWGLVALLALVVLAPPARAVVGGTAADETLARTIVMVLAEGGVACSGVVVAPRAVLTAGHCVPKGKQARVYAPVPGQSAPHLIIPAAVAIHPGFVANAVGARKRSIDLALIRLPEALPSAYGPAELDAGPALAAGASVTIAGDGLASEGDAKSGGKVMAAALPVVEPYGRSTILLWAAPTQGPAGACAGDSGGAMFNSSLSLVAVIAFAEGEGKAHCGKLTQGILAAPQRSFIDTTLARWGMSAHWTDH